MNNLAQSLNVITPILLAATKPQCKPLKLDVSPDIFYCCMVISLLLAGFSYTLQSFAGSKRRGVPYTWSFSALGKRSKVDLCGKRATSFQQVEQLWRIVIKMGKSWRHLCQFPKAIKCWVKLLTSYRIYSSPTFCILKCLEAVTSKAYRVEHSASACSRRETRK